MVSPGISGDKALRAHVTRAFLPSPASPAGDDLSEGEEKTIKKFLFSMKGETNKGQINQLLRHLTTSR